MRRPAPVRLLAIESSCDETSAAVLTAADALAGHVVHTQVALHEQYGGVVPELASRAHVMAIDDVVRRALAEAALSVDELDAIAVTQGPGLKGALLVGIEFAKGLAAARDLPLVGTHHLEGHIRAPWLAVTEGFDPPALPCVALIVSGGHTSLVLCREDGTYEELGRTLDDAAGEAYDKVGKHLGLGYPAGPRIDALAASGDREAWPVPRPMLHKGGHDFSFSGVKTWMAQHVEREGVPVEQALADLCASFQEAVVDVLVAKTRRAARAAGVRHVVVTGGVACNRRLRERMRSACGEDGLALSVPLPALCTDNAAMIAAAAYGRAAQRVADGQRFREWDLDARPGWHLEELDGR